MMTKQTEKQIETGRTVLNIPVDNSMASRIDAAARANFLTRAVFVRQAVAAALRQAERSDRGDQSAAA